MKSSRPRTRVSTAKRISKPRFAQVGNPALRSLYQGTGEAYTPPADELDIPLAERKSLQDLAENSCRWPIGDPQNSDFHFCNQTKVPGLPYCEHHCRRAFQPPQARRRNRTPATEKAPVALPTPTDTAKVDA